MDKSAWFWIIGLLALLAWAGWGFLPAERRPLSGNFFGALVLVLLAILGLAVFQGPVK